MNKVLVIENEIFLLGIIEEWLVFNDFNAIRAETAQEGYQLAQLEQPDLILSCYRLPDCNGLELLQQLRKEFKTKATPFVLMTGMELLDIPQYLYKPNHVVKKPFIPEDLLKTINSHLLLAANPFKG